ncbi:MAG: complex I subunit 5 family protein, partial [Bacteroidales bacterium]|nr:complex I subunit 5 family protein [Bacteroidales bacterium]
MDVLYYIIFLPIVAGIVLFVFPEKLKWIKASIALIISAFVLYFAYQVYLVNEQTINLSLFTEQVATGTLLHQVFNGISKHFALNIDSLSKMIVLFTGIFGFIISIYSSLYVTRKKAIYNYYPFYLITLGCSMGAILADDLLLFIFFWGVLGFTLYKLIKGHDEESSAAAKKTLIVIGSSDGIMIMGIAIIWSLTGTLNMSELDIATSSGIAATAFITLLIGSFTKAGAFPLHTWLPDFSKNAPASTTAYLPASLDKLLGIYFLARICIDLFRVNQWLTLLLLILGVLTIIIAVMMALVQHNFKRLLGFHAVSQVGYMIVGIAIATPLGIAAGLFHMVNNALYKSGLFLSAGSVENRTGKSDLDEVGGLAGKMPVTFFSAIVFALAISGIPPLNGFASKWMIYQGIIDFGHSGAGIASQLWIIWLALAVLGSALTLASFIKFISGIFLGRRKPAFDKIKEVNILMWFPKLLLALICIGFGVFAINWVVPQFFEPYVGEFSFVGIWESTTVSILILLSIVLGFIIYLIGNIRNMRTAESFVGGETFHEQTGFNVTEFYNTVRELKPLKGIYS